MPLFFFSHFSLSFPWHLPQISGSPAIALSCHLCTTILVGIPFFAGAGMCCNTVQFATVTIYNNKTFWLILLPSVFPSLFYHRYAYCLLSPTWSCKCGGLTWEELPGAHWTLSISLRVAMHHQKRVFKLFLRLIETCQIRCENKDPLYS